MIDFLISVFKGTSFSNTFIKKTRESLLNDPPNGWNNSHVELTSQELKKKKKELTAGAIKTSKKEENCRFDDSMLNNSLKVKKNPESLVRK